MDVVQDHEAEKLFVSLIAQEPALVVPYSTRVDYEDLTDIKHRLLWEGFNSALVHKQRPTIEWMRYWLEGKRHGGQTYYSLVGDGYLRSIYSPEMLLGNEPPILGTDKIQLFCDRILDAADRQLRWQISEDLRQSADQKGVNADALWSELFGRVLTRRQARSTVKPLGAFWDRIKAQVDDWWHGRPGNLITTGYPSLDAALGGGICPRRLIIIGGASGGGKTTLLLNIMIEMAKRGFGVGMSSVEMPGEDLIMILACREAGISYRDLRQGLYDVSGSIKGFQREKNKAAMAKFYHEVELLHQLPFQVDDNSDQVTSAQIYTQVLLAAAFGDIDLWGIDYAELLSDGVGQESEAVRIPAIFKASKNLSRLLNNTTVLLSQITKDVKHRPDAKPKKEDLRYGTPAPADYVWMPWYPGGLVATGDVNKHIILKHYGDMGITGEPNQLVIVQAKARYGQNQFVLLDYNPALYHLTDPNEMLATAWYWKQVREKVQIEEGF
jgi:replicative DNA helicase